MVMYLNARNKNSCTYKHGFTHLHLVPRSKINRATPLPPIYTLIAWTGKTVPFTLQTRLYLSTTTAYTI